MGYAGYFSTTNRLKDKPTELQSLLANVKSMESLAVLEKLCYNAVVDPKEPKYRKIKLSNKKIKSTLVDEQGCMAVLSMLGWIEQMDTEGEEVMVLPEKVVLSMAQVRDVQNAQQELKKGLSRSTSSASLRSDVGV